MEIMIPSHSDNPVMKLSVDCSLPERCHFFQVQTVHCWFQGGYHPGKSPTSSGTHEQVSFFLGSAPTFAELQVVMGLFWGRTGNGWVKFIGDV